MNLTCPSDEETLSFSLVLAPPAAGTRTATPRATRQWPRPPNGRRRPGRSGQVRRLVLIASGGDVQQRLQAQRLRRRFCHQGPHRRMLERGMATIVRYLDGRIDVRAWSRGPRPRATCSTPSRISRRSSTTGGSTRTCQTDRSGARRSAMPSVCGAPAQASTAAAISSRLPPTHRRWARWPRSSAARVRCERRSWTSPSTGRASSPTGIPAPRAPPTCGRKYAALRCAI